MHIPDTHPLLLPNLKAQTSPAAYLQSSVKVVEGYGSKGGKRRPFGYAKALDSGTFGSWCYACAMMNAKAKASTPLRLYVKKRGGRKCLFQTARVPGTRRRYLAGDLKAKPSPAVIRKVAELGSDFEEVTEPHPAITTLRTVNPWSNGFELEMLRAVYLQMTGNDYLHPVISPKLGVPVELWPMAPHLVEIIPSRDTLIAGYVYGKGSENERVFAPDEVIHTKNLPDPSDPLFYGMGNAEAAWTALGLHSSKRTMDQAKFDNMARPDYLLIVKNGASDDTLDRFESSVKAKLGGAHKAGQFLTITGDVTAQALNLPVEEIGDPERVIEEICVAFGVPITKMLANQPNRANADAADAAWRKDTVQPLCTLDEEKLNEKYLPLFDVGGDAVLCYDNPVPDDTEAQLAEAKVAVGGPWRTPNEQRAKEGDEPIEGGDVLHKLPGESAPADAGQQDQQGQQPAKGWRARRAAGCCPL